MIFMLTNVLPPPYTLRQAESEEKENEAMKLKLKKSIVLCMICTMLLGMVGIDASAADITYVYGDVGTMHSLVNSFRQSGEGWYWDANGQKVAGQAKAPLAYDYNLEKIAMIRAAELVQSYSHTRPNGQDVSGLVFGLGMSMAGENIAYGDGGLGGAESIFTLWREENQNYNGQGHRRNMLSVDVPFTSIGVGHVQANGRDYWVQVFGSGSGGGSREDLNGSGSAPSDQPQQPDQPQKPEVPVYPVLEGANATWAKSSNSPMVIKIDADVSKFAGVVINGVTVDPANYEVTSGSTVITFKPEYMQLLSAGNYTCRVSYTDGGYADVPFKVDATTGTQTPPSNDQNTAGGTQNNASGSQNNAASTTTGRSPQTGDTSADMSLVFLMFAAAGCMAVCLISKKKAQ